MNGNYSRVIMPYRMSIIERTWDTAEGRFNGCESAILRVSKGGLPESGPFAFLAAGDFRENFEAFKDVADIEAFIQKWEET